MSKIKENNTIYQKAKSNSHFVIDDSGCSIVVYSDQVLNASIQFVWKDPLVKSKIHDMLENELCEWNEEDSN